MAAPELRPAPHDAPAPQPLLVDTPFALALQRIAAAHGRATLEACMAGGASASAGVGAGALPPAVTAAAESTRGRAAVCP